MRFETEDRLHKTGLFLHVFAQFVKKMVKLNINYFKKKEATKIFKI